MTRLRAGDSCELRSSHQHLPPGDGNCWKTTTHYTAKNQRQQHHPEGIIQPVPYETPIPPHLAYSSRTQGCNEKGEAKPPREEETTEAPVTFSADVYPSLIATREPQRGLNKAPVSGNEPLIFSSWVWCQLRSCFIRRNREQAPAAPAAMRCSHGNLPLRGSLC